MATLFPRKGRNNACILVLFRTNLLRWARGGAADLTKQSLHFCNGSLLIGKLIGSSGRRPNFQDYIVLSANFLIRPNQISNTDFNNDGSEDRLGQTHSFPLNSVIATGEVEKPEMARTSRERKIQLVSVILGRGGPRGVGRQVQQGINNAGGGK